MLNKRAEKIITALVFILVPFFLFKDGFQHGKILFGHDTISLDFPFRLFAQKMFQQYHDLPVWMPDLFGGIPLIDSTNLIYFYPTNLIYMLLPIPLYYSYTIDIIIHMLIAAFGMYLLLKQFELKKEASLFGAFIFMISGFLVSLVYAGHWGNIKALALMPYVFYFISRGIREEKFLHFLNASLFAGLMILCIGMQILAYTYIGVFLYIIYELFFTEQSMNMKRIKKITKFFILSLIMVILFGALQFFQTAGYLGYSWRGNFTYADFTSWSFHPLESISFLFPNFYGLKDEAYYGFESPNATTLYIGIVPFMLLPFAFMLKKSRRPAIFFAISAAIFFTLGCGWYMPFYRLLYYIPIFNKFRTPMRYIYFFDTFVIILSAMGLNNILATAWKQGYKSSFKGNALFKIWAWTSSITAIIFLIMLTFVANREHLSDFINQAFVNDWKTHPTVEFTSSAIGHIRTDAICFGLIAFVFLFFVYLSLRRRIKKTYIFLCAITVLALMDLNRIDEKFINFASMQDYFEDNNRIMLQLQQDKEPARTQDVGRHFFYNKNIYYGLEFMSGDHGLLPSKYANMLTKRAFDSLTINRLYNIKYYITDMYIETKDFVELINGPLQLIQDTKVMPRVFFLDKVNKLDDDDQIFSFMTSAQFDPNVVLTTDNININPEPETLHYSLSMTEYTPNKIKLSLDANKAGVLVISNTYYPSWRAKVDNKPEKIYNVDYAIMGIPIARGKHEIELYQNRFKILISLFLTIIGFFIYGVVYFNGKRRKRK